MIQIHSDLRTKIMCSVLWVFWMVILPLTAMAQSSVVTTPETVLVRNVTLIDYKGEKEDTFINILIRDGKLNVVTQDDIAADSAILALDAQQGILMGKLEIGELANFLILARDLREDFQVLLDTATYARFAIRNGVIERNWLSSAFDYGEKSKRSGWLAYTPPPLSLPMSYQNTSK